MSQPKPVIKIEKAKQLREMRLRLDWTQQQMADALGLDPSYLSQLENGRRKLDDWYLKKAGEFEKAKTTDIFGRVTPESFSLQSTAESCITYLRQFLSTCKEPAKVVWTYVELQEHFPLDKWTTAGEEFNSKLPSVAPTAAPKPAADLAVRRTP
jgi:transcriptional regulator with XRE-family HTH domain